MVFYKKWPSQKEMKSTTIVDNKSFYVVTKGFGEVDNVFDLESFFVKWHHQCVI